MIMRFLLRITKKMISHYSQVLFVAIAFTLMVVTSYRFVRDIELKHLHKDVKNAIFNTEAHINADMLEPKTALGNVAETIRIMIIRGYDAKMVNEYIEYINNYSETNKENRLLGINGFYGFFDAYGEGGMFITGEKNWNPPKESYVPQDRPWYIAAVEADGDVGITQPYFNIAAGDITITFARRIFDADNRAMGIVCLNIYLYRIRQLAVDTQFAKNGYGFLLSENLEIIAHPEQKMLGMELSDVHSNIASYKDELIQNGHIYEAISADYRGIESIVFIERLQNGWYMGVVTPRDIYFKSTKTMAIVLSVLGGALAAILMVILFGMLREIHKENYKSQSMAHWYNSILNAIQLPISVTDANANWMFINTAVEKILGITLKDAVGKPCSNWGSVVCNTQDCGIACVKRGITQTYFSEGDLSLQVDTAILKDLNGNTIGYIEIAQDITNLKIMAKKQADAEAANFAKSAFLAKVSHEIRTPMNAILGITEIQLQKDTVPADMQEALGKIYNSGYLLLGIINDILDLSKIESGKLELIPVEYDVPSLINDTVNLNVVRYESKPIEFSLEIDENIPLLLLGDELRIKQILNNLLSNAFKYTASGKVVMSVSLETQQEKAETITLVIRVSDTGQGMTTEQLDKLFNEYMRFNLEMNRAVEGAGLGMSITKHLVQLMNGEIHVESEPGKGSVFTVRLPQGCVAGSGVLGKELVQKIGQLRLGRNAQMKKAPVVHEYMPYGRVLVVDDVETNLYVTRGLLAPYGMSVETADSGYEVIEKIKNGSIWDIIFMDHFMPGIDGVETAKMIRSMGYTKPIVALTANVITGQAEMFYANGFDDFISKPIDIRQLNAVLNKLIRDKYAAETIDSARRLKNSMEHYSGTESQPAINPELAHIFIRDAEKALAVLGKVYEKRGNYEGDDIESFIINAHAMKSALLNVGESNLSALAAKLEQAGHEQNATVIQKETPGFLAALQVVIKKLKTVN